MDKTPWIPSKKTTKADLKRILQIMGVVPPKEYDAKDLRELVTETHAEFMSLLAEGTSGAAAVAGEKLAESASASSAAASSAAAPAASGIVVSHRRGFQVDFDDPPLGGGAAVAATAPDEDSAEHMDVPTFMQLIDKKRKAIQDTGVLLEEMQHLSTDGDTATQMLIVKFMRESVGMSPSDLVRAIAQLERQVRASASSSDVFGHGEELEYAVGAASRGGTDDI